MGRRGWTMVAGALALIAVGAVTWLRDGSHGRRAGPISGPPRPAAGAPAAGVALAEPAAAPSADAAPHRSRSRRRRSRSPVAADGGAVRASGRAELPNARPEQAPPRSAGWRLGRTRRRIEILEPRIAEYEQHVRRFEEQGQPDLAARQAEILDRFRTRLSGLRSEEGELLDQARRTGTLGDVDEGYERGEAIRRQGRPGAGASATPR